LEDIGVVGNKQNPLVNLNLPAQNSSEAAMELLLTQLSEQDRIAYR
jgi:hypothetical protein